MVLEKEIPKFVEWVGPAFFSYLLGLAIFAVIYVLISEGNPESFTEPLDRFTAYYFALTVLATVGFGDITPVTTLARAVTMIQMSLDLALIAVLVKVMGGAAKSALGKRKQPPSSE